jgi:plasmid stabilization system protein ParE
LAHLVFRTAALRHLAEIAEYIETESMSRATADAFIDRLVAYCEHLATLPGLIGSPRAELRPQYRSTTFGRYVIFFRYSDEDGPRSHLYVVDVVHGSRDIEAYFATQPDDEGC